jgi:hypothetical protein
MKIHLGKLARPQHAEGGSIILGDLTAEEIGKLVTFLSVACSFTQLRDHYQQLLGVAEALRDGLKEIVGGGFEEKENPGLPGPDK